MTFAFFRKYNKIILAVGGSILMVIFLIPQVSFMATGKPGDQLVGTIGEREILVSDRQTAAAEIELLRRLNQQIADTLPRGNEGSLQWLLMIEEARRQGLWSSRAEAMSVLQALEVDPQQLAVILRDMGAGEDFLHRALSHWRMVMLVQEMVAGTRRPSELELRRFARDVQSQVAVKLVGVPAELLLDQIEPPTQQELEERFQLNRNDFPGISEPYGFGYRFEPRAKLEYLAFPLDRARASVSVDEVEAQRYYMEHPAEFMPPAPESVIPPVEGEAQAPVEPQPLPYREVRQRIIDGLSLQQAVQVQQQSVREALGLLNESVRRYERDAETGYIDIPPAADIVPLEQVAQQVQNSTGILPDAVRLESEWTPLSKLGDLPGVGRAYYVIGSGENRRGVTLAGYLSVAREFTPPENHPLAALRLQVGVPSAVLQDDEGTVYLVRLIAAESARAPVSLDEARDQVEHDVKLLKAFGLLKQRAEEYAARAGQEGLEAVAGSLGEDVKPTDIELFTRRELNPQSMTLSVPELPVVGRSPQFVDGAFQIADPMEAAGSLDAVPEDQRIGTVAVDRQLTLYVVQITGYEPLTAETYAGLRQLLLRMMAQLDLLELLQSGYQPFTIEALANRVGFSPNRPEGMEESEEDGEPMPIQ